MKFTQFQKTPSKMLVWLKVIGYIKKINNQKNRLTIWKKRLVPCDIFTKKKSHKTLGMLDGNTFTEKSQTGKSLNEIEPM